MLSILAAASSAYDGIGKLPSEMDMTDGCGWANAPLLKYLREVFEWESFPTAIQCRLAGAKVCISGQSCKLH